MNFLDIQNEIISTRFDESRRAQVKLWIQSRYATLWSAANWNFRHVLDASFAVTSGANNPTMPTDLSSVEAIIDNFGQPLAYLGPMAWRDQFLSSSTVTGQPSSYTMVAGQVYLGPTPQASATFLISYARRVSHLDASGNVVSGNLSADTDRPIWSQTNFAEYDYILVLDGMMLGQQMLNDPTAYTLQGQRDELLQAMKSDLVGSVEGEYMGQWGGSLVGGYS